MVRGFFGCNKPLIYRSIVKLFSKVSFNYSLYVATHCAMEKYLPYGVLFLRLALAVSFLAIVADKLGYWGEHESESILWGTWDKYASYFQSLIPFIPAGVAEKIAAATTSLEVVLALMLLVGLKVRWAAIATSIYTFVLVILMFISMHPEAPFNSGLLLISSASFLLACCPIYKWTLHGIKKRSTYHPY